MTPAELDHINRERVVARVLSSAVHDARNALQGISGTAELLMMGLPAPRAEERARGILRQAAWLSERLEQLLAVNADQPAGGERLDLARVCTRALDLRLASWGRLSIKPSVQVPAGTQIHADANRVIRILANLLLNSERSLVAAGGGTITFTAGSAGECVELVVEDSGPGVPAEVEPYLFAAAGVNGRLTTGLAASKALATAMGGSLVWLGPTRRAAFVLRLPTSRPAPGAAACQ